MEQHHRGFPREGGVSCAVDTEDLMAHLTRPAKQGQWSESALRVLRERYLDRSRKPLSSEAASSGGVGETPEDMCWRVAGAIANAARDKEKEQTAPTH